MCLRKALLSDSVVVWRNLRSSSVCSWAPLQAIRVGSFLDLSHPKSWGADLTGKQISQVRWLASRQQESASLYLSLHALLLFLFKFWVLATLNRSQGTQRGFKLSDLKMRLAKRGVVTLGGWLGSSPGTPWHVSVESSFHLFLLGGKMLISSVSSSHICTVPHWGLLTALLPMCPVPQVPRDVSCLQSMMSTPLPSVIMNVFPFGFWLTG